MSDRAASCSREVLQPLQTAVHILLAFTKEIPSFLMNSEPFFPIALEGKKKEKHTHCRFWCFLILLLLHFLFYTMFDVRITGYRFNILNFLKDEPRKPLTCYCQNTHKHSYLSTLQTCLMLALLHLWLHWTPKQKNRRSSPSLQANPSWRLPCYWRSTLIYTDPIV